MNKEEINIINQGHARGIDKYYRMFAGLSSEMTNAEDETLFLTVKHSAKWQKDPVTTAVQLSRGWQRYLKETHNIIVKSYQVTIIFISTEEEPGYYFNESTPISLIKRKEENLKRLSLVDFGQRPKLEIKGQIGEDLRFWWHAKECAHFCQNKKKSK